MSLLNRPEFTDVRKFFEREVEGHEDISAAELFNKIDQNRQLENAAAIVMGILEDMSIAIQHNYVDEDILYTSLFTIVRRKKKGDDRKYLNKLT